MRQPQTADKVSPFIDHLFRHETGKLIGDSLLEAITIRNYQGIPDNPSGWLYKVAKNKALNVMNREKYKREYTSEVYL